MKTIQSKKQSKRIVTSAKRFPWRKVRGKWTNTLFEKKLIKNPSLLTNKELAAALAEYNAWRRSTGKYHWDTNPSAEGAEQEPPFSCEVLGRFIDEVCTRLLITHNLTAGRFK